MAIMSFRRPEEGLDYYKQSLDLIYVLQDIIKNPTAANAVKELSRELTISQELSESKKQIARDAEEIIAQSKEFLEDFEKQKNLHSDKVKIDLTEIENRRKVLQSEIQNFATEKANTQKTLEKMKSDAEEKHATAKQIHEEAKIRNAKAEKLESVHSAAVAEHATAVSDFEKAKVDVAAEFEAKQANHEKEVAKLKAAQAAFEIRKKRFDDALKE